MYYILFICSAFAESLPHVQMHALLIVKTAEELTPCSDACPLHRWGYWGAYPMFRCMPSSSSRLLKSLPHVQMHALFIMETTEELTPCSDAYPPHHQATEELTLCSDACPPHGRDCWRACPMFRCMLSSSSRLLRSSPHVQMHALLIVETTEELTPCSDACPLHRRDYWGTYPMFRCMPSSSSRLLRSLPHVQMHALLIVEATEECVEDVFLVLLLTAGAWFGPHLITAQITYKV